MILSEKIIFLRKQNGWSQEQLAEQLNVSRQSVSKWESGSSIPDIDKLLKLSNIFGVSTDYLLKDDAKEEISSQVQEDVYEKDELIIELEEANAYLERVEKDRKKIALGVALCILSPICTILLGGLADRNLFGITEDFAGSVGITAMLIIIAIAVALLISSGMRLEKYEYLKKKNFTLAYGVYGIVNQKKESHENKFQSAIVLGIVLCILAVVPIMLAAGLNGDDLTAILCVCVLLAIISVGVSLFILAGMIRDSYDVLLQEGDYTKEKKELNKKTDPLSGAYWCIVTAFYLYDSFSSGQWYRTWIIWPVAGVLYAAICAVVEIILFNRKKN